MSIVQHKRFWLFGSFFGLAFLVLFSIRMGWIQNILSRPKTLSLESFSEVAERDTWMNIFQNNRKIGFSHSIFSKLDTGYRVKETVFMRINTMGMVQGINLKTEGRLHPDFTIASIKFKINSGRFQFAVDAKLSDHVMTVQTKSAGDSRRLQIKIKDKPYLFAGILNAVTSTKPKPGEKFAFHIFDPGTLTQQPVHVEVIGHEHIELAGEQIAATKIAMSLKGATQLAWIDDNGDVLKEKGLLGIQLQKTNRQDALYGQPLAASQDLTETASVAVNVPLDNIERLEQLRLEISGIPMQQLHLRGGRQVLVENLLTINRENLSDLAENLDSDNLGTLEKIFLKPSPFIQSDHERIRKLVEEIIGPNSSATPLEKAQKLLDWVHHNIEKRPVLSLPDALSTLENRMGDCNEHAVLMAALARAAGLPCRVEAGLAYLKGRFYYHAWNLVYVGRWVTLDSLFGQLPADVGHIRFITGTQQQQIDIMGIIGKVQIRIIS
jgi:hypothetical protein